MMNKRELGLKIVAAMKANVYDMTVGEALEHCVLDVVNKTGEYADVPDDSAMLQAERASLYKQADFVGEYVAGLVSGMGKEFELYSTEYVEALQDSACIMANAINCNDKHVDIKAQALADAKQAAKAYFKNENDHCGD